MCDVAPQDVGDDGFAGQRPRFAVFDAALPVADEQLPQLRRQRQVELRRANCCFAAMHVDIAATTVAVVS